MEPSVMRLKLDHSHHSWRGLHDCTAITGKHLGEFVFPQPIDGIYFRAENCPETGQLTILTLEYFHPTLPSFIV